MCCGKINSLVYTSNRARGSKRNPVGPRCRVKGEEEGGTSSGASWYVKSSCCSRRYVICQTLLIISISNAAEMNHCVTLWMQPHTLKTQIPISQNVYQLSILNVPCTPTRATLNERETSDSESSNSSLCLSSGRGIRLPPCGRGLCRFTGNTRNQEVESFSSRHKTKNKKQKKNSGCRDYLMNSGK